MRNDEATQALLAHSRGDLNAASQLMPIVYGKLRALAAHYMRAERFDHTLQPTALVHEAYLRLIEPNQVDWQGKTHFFAIAATQMRRVLTEHARSHKAKKRGGGARRITLHDVAAVTPEGTVDMLLLDEVLDRLAQQSVRQSRVVELRFFAGLSVDEAARILGVYAGTVKGDWRMAKASLARELAEK